MKAIRDASPQALHHFTRFDKVNQLVSASEADADLGLWRERWRCAACLAPTPASNAVCPAQRPLHLVMSAARLNKLPYGNLPRLLLAWVCTEAVRTGSRELVLGKSLSKFMRTLGIYNSGGKPQTRLRNQMKRLFGCTVSMIYEDEHGEQFLSSVIADRGEFWWDPKRPDERGSI